MASGTLEHTHALEQYRQAVLVHRLVESTYERRASFAAGIALTLASPSRLVAAHVRALCVFRVKEKREKLKKAREDVDKTDDDLKSLQVRARTGVWTWM